MAYQISRILIDLSLSSRERARDVRHASTSRLVESAALRCRWHVIIIHVKRKKVEIKKIRVKSTGTIYIVPDYVTISVEECNSYGSPLTFSLDEIEILDEDKTALSREQATLDYWTRLENQAAIAAMQGMLNNSLLITGLLKVNKSHEDIVAEVTGTAIRYAHALVEKMKEERK